LHPLVGLTGKGTDDWQEVIQPDSKVIDIKEKVTTGSTRQTPPNKLEIEMF